MDAFVRRVRPYTVGNLFFVCIVVFLSLREVHIFFKEVDFSITVSACKYLLNGQTHWRAFQNRVLGPAVIDLINQIVYAHDMRGYVKSLKLFLCIFLPLSNLYILFCLKDLTVIEKISAYLAINIFFLMAGSNLWYPWDNLEFMCFFMLFWMASRNVPLWGYWILFVLWTLTKETSLFVPFLLALFVLRCSHSMPGTERRKYILSTVLMFVCVFSYTYFFRKYFFCFSTLPGVGADMSHNGIGNFLSLWHNLKSIFLFKRKDILFVWSIYLVYLWGTFHIVKYRATLGPRFLILWGVMGVYLLLCLVSALVDELRVFYPLGAMLPGLYLSQEHMRIKLTY